MKHLLNKPVINYVFEQVKLLNCSQCKQTRYCGRDCQRTAWPEHKKRCKSGVAATTTPPTTPQVKPPLETIDLSDQTDPVSSDEADKTPPKRRGTKKLATPAKRPPKLNLNAIDSDGVISDSENLIAQSENDWGAKELVKPATTSPIVLAALPAPPLKPTDQNKQMCISLISDDDDNDDVAMNKTLKRRSSNYEVW